MSDIQDLYIVERTTNEVIASGVLETPAPHYSAQKRRLISMLEALMSSGAESFVLRTGKSDWTLEPIGPARVVRR